MTQRQFGIWSAIAIHDTSSVVGAAARFGMEALHIATTVKLTRALWIVPLTLATAAAFRKRSARVAVPWFIGFYLLASVMLTYSLLPPWLFADIVMLARIGLTLTLFLIGARLSRAAIASVGAPPLI